MANDKTNGSGAGSTDTTKKSGKGGKRTAKSTAQQIENANRAIERATTNIVNLHIKANNMAGVQGILDARKSLAAALVAPPEAPVQG